MSQWPTASHSVGRDDQLEDLPRGTETILLAEDTHWVRAITAASLVALGYQVLLAEDGPEALSIARDEDQSVDAILSDMDIPLLDGVSLSETLQREKPEIPIILSSSGGSCLFQEEVPELAAHIRLLPKPYTLAGLATSLRDAIDTKSSFPSLPTQSV